MLVSIQKKLLKKYVAKSFNVYGKMENAVDIGQIFNALLRVYCEFLSLIFILN